MYYIAKTLEFLGLAVIAVGMVVRYPDLMDPKMFGTGIIFFGTGWIIEKYMLE